MTEVRVRFAPSPTGSLHIGGARTALFNWLFARNTGGKFILRIEDTDFSRSTEDSAQGIVEGLQWLGLDWDEGPDKEGVFGPYRQSERFAIYSGYLQQLLNNNMAYYCFCTPEDLKQEKERAREDKRDYKYSGKCKTVSPEEIEKLQQEGKQPVIRLKVPSDGNTVVHDLIRGDVSFANALMDDFIIAKSDGWPTYNFAVVIDDYTMKISHVIRAEEHLSNTPRQLCIYYALGIKPPQFAHVSMILAPDRSKLSKRHGAISVQEFQQQGYLPEALVNYLALLGWSTGRDVDIWDINEMIQAFNLDSVSKSPAIYDLQKLAWMNGQYFNQMDIGKLLDQLSPQARELGWLNDENCNYFRQVIELVRSRARNMEELFEACTYFFEEVTVYDEKGVNKYFYRENSRLILQESSNMISLINFFSAPELEKALREKAEQMNLKAGDMIHPLRLALTGRTATPGLFELMELLGREKCLLRLGQALKNL